MDLLQVAVTSVGAFVALFLLSKLMGHRQISELSVFDYVNGITIGSIAAEMATALEDDFLNPMLGMAVYTAAALLISLVATHSIKLRKFLIGKPLILYDNGKLYRKNLKRAKLDLNEFLTQCRVAGYFNLASVQTAVFETNGKISFLPVAGQRPATPDDFNLSPQQEHIPTTVLIDGVVLEQNLRTIGKNGQWLDKQLKKQGFPEAKDIFLVTCDSNDNVSVYVKLDNP